MPNANIVSLDNAPPEKISRNPRRAPSLLLQEIKEFFIIDPRCRDMCADPVDRQHRQCKYNTAPQFRNFENILEARDEPFKHGQSPSLVPRLAQSFVGLPC